MSNLQEIKETVFIGIAAATLAIVLSLVSIFISMRNDLAYARNQEVAASKTLLDYRKFNRYDNKVVYGDEIIELIRLYGGQDIEIKVFGDGATKTYTGEETLAALQSLFQLDTQLKTYQAYLAYNSANLATTAFPMRGISGSEVTGIKLVYLGLIPKE